jgi:hypothetical protein
MGARKGGLVSAGGKRETVPAGNALAGIPGDVSENLAFLARAVRYLAAERGIRQFLEIGAGLRAGDTVGEVARSAAPDSRVAYAGDDLRDTREILGAAARTLDFSRPVAIVLAAILHRIPDDDDPYQIVATLMAATAPGSYLVISHQASDIRPAAVAAAAGPAGRRNARPGTAGATARDLAQVTRFFDGLELAEPGIVQPQWWRPPVPVTQADVPLWCGVARKP